jgi:hypothetical protein
LNQRGKGHDDEHDDRLGLARAKVSISESILEDV